MTFFAMGMVVGSILIATQARATGGLTGILSVGADAAVRPFIETQLGDIAVQRGAGHDGQIYYAIALDLTGETVPDLLNNPGLRYRRILFPAVASLFGLLDGLPLLWSEVILSIVSLGLAVAAGARLADQFGVSRLIVLGLLANPGIWLAVRLLTPDPLAFALLLWGVSIAVDQRHAIAIPLLAAAALTKEPYLMVAFGVASWMWFDRRRIVALGYAVGAIAPVGLWSIWLANWLGANSLQNGNLAVPFLGIIRGMSDWGSTSPQDQLYGAITILMLVAAAVAVHRAKSRLLTWLLAPWFLVAVISSDWIWNIGNGLMRNFAIVGFFGTLAVGVLKARGAEVEAEPSS